MKQTAEQIKKLLIDQGLGPVQVTPQRLPGGGTQFNIKVGFNPDTFVPVEESEPKVHHVPVPAKGKEELADKGRYALDPDLDLGEIGFPEQVGLPVGDRVCERLGEEAGPATGVHARQLADDLREARMRVERGIDDADLLEAMAHEAPHVLCDRGGSEDVDVAA